MAVFFLCTPGMGVISMVKYLIHVDRSNGKDEEQDCTFTWGGLTDTGNPSSDRWMNRLVES